MEKLNWTPVQAPGPVTLRGRYVTLEPLNVEQHAESLWTAVEGHDEVWAWLADGPYATEAEFREAIAKKQHADNAVFLAVIPEGKSEAGGYASFMRIDAAHGVIEVGNILFTPQLQRTRAATEAMYLMAAHVFGLLGYRRYEWKCNARNEPSRRAAQRFGFTFEGIFRQHMVVKDVNRDTAWFSIVDHEWPARKRAFETWLEPGNFDSEGKQQRSLRAHTGSTA
jgi:RimJ/RimL family protein N-acetyltransferase